MKKIRLNVTSLLSRLCAATVAIMGFGCSSEGECMYGTPTGSFEVKGCVTDEEGNPVEDAKIRVTNPKAYSGTFNYGTTDSDSDGNYKLERPNVFTDSLKIVCIPGNQNLQPDSLSVKIDFEHDSKHDKLHKDAWMYVGHADVTANFKLKKKQ